MAKKPVKKTSAAKPVKKTAKKSVTKVPAKTAKKSTPSKKTTTSKVVAKKKETKKSVTKSVSKAPKTSVSSKVSKKQETKAQAKKSAPVKSASKSVISKSSVKTAKPKLTENKKPAKIPTATLKPAQKNQASVKSVASKPKPIATPEPKKNSGSATLKSPAGKEASKKAVAKPSTPVKDKRKDIDDEDPNQGFVPYKPPPDLPEPVIDKSGWLTRTKFSDSELKEFRDIIKKKLDKAINDYELLKDTISHRDNNGTDDTSPTFKLLEDGSEVMSKEETTQLALRQQKYIQALENALIRIENKTYGICRGTGQMISKERLKSVPHATLSIEAKKSQQD